MLYSPSALPLPQSASVLPKPEQMHQPSMPLFAFVHLTRRVYGSPQLDALLEGSDERLQELLQELGRAF